jgi:hypothetical protein
VIISTLLQYDFDLLQFYLILSIGTINRDGTRCDEGLIARIKKTKIILQFTEEQPLELTFSTSSIVASIVA